MALETRFLRICPTNDGSLWTFSWADSISSRRPLLAAMVANSGRNSSNRAATVKSVGSGLMAPDSSLLISSNAFSSRDMAPIACSCCESASLATGSRTIRRKLPLRSARVCRGWRSRDWRWPESGSSLGWLDRPPRGPDQFKLGALSIRDVSYRGGHQHLAALCDRAQADLDREFLAVSLSPEELEPLAHRAHANLFA